MLKKSKTLLSFPLNSIFDFDDSRQNILKGLSGKKIFSYQSLVQLLQTEGIKLMEKPIAPQDTKLRPKKYKDNPILPADMKEWKVYSEWVEKITKEALERFQVACNHGVSLNNPLIVCNSAVYVWNYTKHLLEKKEYSLLTQQYLPLFNSLKKIGHGTETVFLCDFAHALAQGFMKPHIPQAYHNPAQKRLLTPAVTTPAQGSRRSGRGGATSHLNINKGKAGIYKFVCLLYTSTQYSEVMKKGG